MIGFPKHLLKQSESMTQQKERRRCRNDISNHYPNKLLFFYLIWFGFMAYQQLLVI